MNPVRSFETFTRDLNELADWSQECRVRTIAMESTGVYWIPLYQILEGRGFQVFLVNAQHVKNVPGRKSDVSDCQWIQYLHSVGLLKASFRPPDEICVIRSLWRHRESLIHMAAEHIMHMQKALSQMNLQSDTPRGAGGLMSWTASKAVGHWFRRRAQARLCQQFRTTRLLHPRCLVRGCIGGLAPTQIQPWIRHSRELKNARL